MINEWTIYWITRLDGVNQMIRFIFACLLFCAIGGAVATVIAAFIDSDWKIPFKIAIACFTACLLVMFVNIFIPSTKDVILIFGIPRVLDSQSKAITKAGKLPEKMIDYIDTWIDKQTPSRGKEEALRK